MITHLEPDILECGVKWASGSITTNKASGSDGNPVELFQILKDDSVTLNMPANLENSAVATGLEKVSFYSNPKERQCQRMFKLLHNCTHLTHLALVHFKIQPFNKTDWGIPWWNSLVRTQHFYCKGPSLTPGWGTKILQIAHYS